MSTILDQNEIREVKKETDIPHKSAALKADLFRWFIIAVTQSLAIAIAVLFCWYAFEKANNNKEVVYVKLYPDGTSDVGEFTPKDEQLYFRSTIDAAFERFIKTRFGQMPNTIKRDYGEAGVFLSDPLYNEFVSSAPGGFNAIQKAADVSANIKNADRIEITWGFSDHYDKIPAVFDKENGEAVRSNIYFTMTTKSAAGLMKQSGAVKKILRATWRLLPKAQLAERKMDWLRVNPVGVEIIQYDLIDDPAGYSGNEEGK